ncbi:MAG TPA: DEAD/DEAH box helicase, partial [Fibrobacteres bacterium]|nr:DEAD/DEAH box helicase [Fibrobacterota bacterium]
MTEKITESAIEKFAIDLLEKSGYQYVYGPDIAPDRDVQVSRVQDAQERPPDRDTPQRQSFEDVLLLDRLTLAISRINPTVPAEAKKDALKQILRLNSPELIANNEAFHRMLTEGIKVSYQKYGGNRGDLVWLIDFNDMDNNDFLVVNQFTIIENNVNKRPDVVLFVNGLPLVLIELKNSADENATVNSAFKQIQTYKQAIPNLFTYNGFVIISDGLEAKVGTISAGFSRFMAWKTADGKVEASPFIGQLETLIKGMLCRSTLIDLIRHFIVFEKSKKEDKETGIITIQTVKKLAAYHQYYAVNRAVESTLRAADYAMSSSPSRASGLSATASVIPLPEALEGSVVMESPASYGVPGTELQSVGDRKGGVVWHTQGSGKSLSMVFYTGKIVLAMDNPTIVMITDRNDLDDQLFDT